MANAKSIFPIGVRGSRGYTSHIITYQQAKDAIDAFRKRDRKPEFAASVESGELFYSVSFNAKAIKRLLKETKGKGFKTYLAHMDGHDTVVHVATDENGKDIEVMALNAGVLCPPHCGIPPVPNPVEND